MTCCSFAMYANAYGMRSMPPGQYGYDADWPRRRERPASPELSRLRVLNNQALERFHTKNREMGRRILADLDSGVRWQRELKRRTEVEEYLRNGPVIHRVRVIR